jgi:hypothetical protein
VMVSRKNCNEFPNSVVMRIVKTHVQVADYKLLKKYPIPCGELSMR